MVKIDYGKAFVITLVLVLIGLAGVKMLDDAKLASLSNDVQSAVDELESTRLLFLYSQTFQDQNSSAFCTALEFSTEKQMDKGTNFITRLKQLEDANLFADYRETQRRYFLSNVELWLYATQAREKCKGDAFISILFFHETKTHCPDCIVQGQILDEVRAECGNVRVITLATDLDIDLVDLIKTRYNVTSAPSMVFDDGTVIRGLVKKEKVMAKIDCRKTKANEQSAPLVVNGTDNGTKNSSQ
ncbi:Uncharacterised protein [Candidatus Gugararchaeum adminiculabundum]|nr:Uncharacterised protein [Candidatus Gugararchaeum adminiculabundum]